MKNLYRLLIFIAVVLLCGAIAWIYFSPAKTRLKVHSATVKELKEMARLCSVEIYEEVPVRGHVGSRHLVARDVLKGTIAFDIDAITMEESPGSDTLRVTLPREIVEIYESTEPGAYQVIDSWNDRFLGSSRITAAEENRMKQLTVESFVRAVYAKGYVRQARADAVTNLTTLLSAVTRRPVIVTDPSPEGYYGR